MEIDSTIYQEAIELITNEMYVDEKKMKKMLIRILNQVATNKKTKNHGTAEMNRMIDHIIREELENDSDKH